MSNILVACFATLLRQGIARGTAGHAVMLKWTMSNIYGLSPGEVRLRPLLSNY